MSLEWGGFPQKGSSCTQKAPNWAEPQLPWGSLQAIHPWFRHIPLITFILLWTDLGIMEELFPSPWGISIAPQLFPEQCKELMLPITTQFSFSKPALSCPGLFKLTFLAFTFIPLSVIKILITPLRPLETCSVYKALACIRRDHFPPEFQYWCICCQAEESQKHMHSFSWTLLQQKKAPEP